MEGAECRNTLRLGVCTTIGSCLAYPMTAACRRELGIEFSVEVGNSRSLEKRLLNARLDLAVVKAGKLSQYLEWIPLPGTGRAAGGKAGSDQRKGKALRQTVCAGLPQG